MRSAKALLRLTVACLSFLISGAADVLPFVESDLKKIALLVIERAKDLCSAFPVIPIVPDGLLCC